MDQKNHIPARADIAAASAMHGQWLEHVSANGTDLCIDCSHVEFLGAAAAQLLVATSKMLQSSGRSLKFQNVSQAFHSDLVMLGLAEYLLPEYPLHEEKS